MTARPRTAPVDLAPLTARLTAARDVLARLGAGAVDGETRGTRREALDNARLDARFVAGKAKALGAATLARDAKALANALFEALLVVDPSPQAAPVRARPAWHVVVLTAVFALRALLQRQPGDLWSSAPTDPSTAALRLLALAINHWIGAFVDVDDYQAAGLGAKMESIASQGYHTFWFEPTTPRPATPAQIEQWAADAAAKNTPAAHAARARQHLNGAHLALAEYSAPFGRDGVFVRTKDALGDVAHHLEQANEEIAALDGADVQELLAARARLAGLLAATTGAAS
jgi:hypothetical protein